MDRYSKAVFASAIFAAVILIFYFYFRGSTGGEVAETAIKDSAPTQMPSALPPPMAKPKAREPDEPDKQKVTASAKWLAGWWSEDGFCEGDAGETFLENGDWGRWGVDGNWKLDGYVLTVTETTLVADTESGEPEPINPPVVSSGTISNITANSFDLKKGGSVLRMARCPEGE
ncbi:hypothetical protein [Sphingopyxis terrae]|nr:hypothetical protein [Sphingopyxis terrae]